MLEPRLWLRPRSLNDRPRIKFLTNGQPVQIGVFNTGVSLFALDAAENIDAFQGDLASNELPVNLCQMVQTKSVSFSVGCKTHS